MTKEDGTQGEGRRFKVRQKLVAHRVKTKEILSKQAKIIAEQAEEHERFINKSLVFSSPDKIVSVFIHLLPGLVFFTIRWWDPNMIDQQAGNRTAWPHVEDKKTLWTWLFLVPLVAYTLWQVLYFLIVNVLRRQRLLRDPEVMTSYRELSKKAKKANNVWWRLSGLLGDQNRLFMYIVLQAAFTVATMALTVPIFMVYELHATFQILKVSAAVWNGGSFLLEVMPRQVVMKEKKKLEMQPIVSCESTDAQNQACIQNGLQTADGPANTQNAVPDSS